MFVQTSILRKICNGFRALSRSTVKSKKRRLDMQQLCMLYSADCLHALKCWFQTAPVSHAYKSYDVTHIAWKTTMDWFKCIILKGSSHTYNYSVSNTFKYIMFAIKLIARYFLRYFSTSARHINVHSESSLDLNIKYHKPFKPG